MDLSIHADPIALAEAAASRIAAWVSEGPTTVGLTGGSTPGDTYDALGRHDVAWDQVWLWMSDERWVPHDHPESNGGMALEHLPPEAEQRLVRPEYSPHLDPIDSAAQYEEKLRDMHDDGRVDLVLLGLGSDGHTASLFPGTDALEPDPDRWFVANRVPQIDTWRLTATPLLLTTARRVLVLVTGDSKAAVLADALEGPDGRYPIQLLRHAEGDVTVLCDRGAASALSG